MPSTRATAKAEIKVDKKPDRKREVLSSRYLLAMR